MLKPKRDDRFVFKLTQAEKRQLKELAIERDITVSQMLRHAVRELLAPTRTASR